LRIVIRTSRWAIWSRRFAGLALPLLVLPVILHRERYLDSSAFFWVMLLAAAVAGLAVLAGVVALVRLWYSGDQGWGRALSGLFFGLLCLMPFGCYTSLALRYPPVTDIATVDRAMLPLVFEPDTVTIPPPRMLGADNQLELFPNVTTRTYPLDVIQVFALVDRLVRAQGWDVRQRIEPLDPGETGRINARIVTIPGWREEAVLRIAPVPKGSSVDMRSASIGAEHDFGSNGTRIEDFLVALDTEVTAFLRDNPNVTNAPPVEDAAPDVETGTGE
jgi:hypothetical protein